MAKNILICDDAAFMRMMIKDILTKNGYNVAAEAENGAKAVEKYNDDVHKFCIFEHTTSKGNTIGLKITSDELEILLQKMDEIKVGNMNLNCDYFEKEYTIVKDINHILAVGFYIKTKLDANKGQQWYLKIDDGIHDVMVFPSFNDIYQVFGKARAKLQIL